MHNIEDILDESSFRYVCMNGTRQLAHDAMNSSQELQFKKGGERNTMKSPMAHEPRGHRAPITHL